MLKSEGLTRNVHCRSSDFITFNTINPRIAAARSDFKAAVTSARRLYAACLADELTELSAAALKTLRTLLEAPETHPAVRLKAALAILERPGFPSPGWQLPAEIASPRERQTISELSLMEADYKRLRTTEAVLRSEARNGSEP